MPGTKRKASFDCSRSLNVEIPDRVSHWQIYHLETLNIFYAKDFSQDPLEILGRISPLKDLDEEQQSYIYSVKDFLKFDSSVSKLKFQRSVVHSTICGLDAKLTTEPNKVTTVKEAFVSHKLKRFINALDRLLSEVHDHHRHLKSYEGVFSRFICAFADLCCLEPIHCSKAEQATWKNLQGKTVKSEPDFRFFKLGLQQITTDVCVSVFEVKRKDKEEHQRWKKSRRSIISSTSESFSESSCSSTQSDEYHRRFKIKEKREPPLIEDIINERVLGQHGGQLLLDLNKFYGHLEMDVLSIPGMIVDETTVIFTLLEMSKKHLAKLKDNHQLDDEDEATIYYSPPYDVLCEESRGILIEHFMRLNNIDV